MSAHLLERDRFLEDLAGLLDDVGHGSGRCALISGEAGIGKSALIERFAELHGASARFCWGRCEALFTPRPLGPLHDIAWQLQGRPQAMLEAEGVSRAALFAAFLDALSDSSQPTVAVIEDVHWADEATLDLLKFLGRRVQQARVLLVITYRDDEIGPDHPLRFVLGDLPIGATKRLRLPPLTSDAVAALARDADRPAGGLYETTGGNPFFVTEVLASDEDGVPETVRDAVLARITRLSAPGHAVLELASLIPARAEVWLLTSLLGERASAIEECMRAGVLRAHGDAVAFRHELARKALESTVPPSRSVELHVAVLRALLDKEDLSKSDSATPLSRLVHHAALAGDGAAVLRFAPQAARQAARQGAHREAAMHYETALRYAASLSHASRAELLEGRSYECYLTGRVSDAVAARTEALRLWRELGAADKVGRNLRWLSRLHWFIGEKAEAERFAGEAVAALEALAPGDELAQRELAMAYSNLAQLRMLEEDAPGAVRWGTRALALAETLGDDDIRAHALNNVGAARYEHADEDGYTHLEASLRLALERGFEEHAARAYTNIASCAAVLRQYARATRYLDEGIAYCAERDLDLWRLYMMGWRARVRFETGDWQEAADEASEVLASPRIAPVMRTPSLVVLAWVRLRRGDSGSQPLLDEATQIARKTGEPQRIVPVAAARAEAAWLRGDLATCQAEARAGYDFAREYAGSYSLAQLYYWLWKSGAELDPPEGLPQPYAAQCAGDWQSAAEAWERVGCPYEQALALAEGDAKARRIALEILDRLGAHATLDHLRGRVGAGPAAGSPSGALRGPRPSTRGNPSGLTNQQLEVLRLMAAGLRNGEIAQTLQISAKTVEHHVSAVLSKLHARSRAQAVSQAHSMGVIPKMGDQERQR